MNQDTARPASPCLLVQPKWIVRGLFLAPNGVIRLVCGASSSAPSSTANRTGGIFDCVSSALGSVAHTLSNTRNCLAETWSVLNNLNTPAARTALILTSNGITISIYPHPPQPHKGIYSSPAISATESRLHERHSAIIAFISRSSA